MRPRIVYRCLAACVVVALALAGLAPGATSHAPRARAADAEATGEQFSPLTVSVTTDGTPAVGDETGVNIEISSVIDAPGTRVSLVVDDGLSVNGQSSWQVDVAAGQPVQLAT